MSIELPIASQIGDATRPPQQQRDRQDQQIVSQVTATTDATKLAEERVTPDELRAAAAEVQQVVEVASGRDLAFQIFEETESLFVEISDRKSGDVIKQIPSEEVLRMRARIQKMVGMMIDERV